MGKLWPFCRGLCLVITSFGNILSVSLQYLKAVGALFFFMATGFHGMHVLIGTSFLIYNLYRSIEHEFSGKKSTGFEMGTWYWHFVDLIWIALFATIYAMN